MTYAYYRITFIFQLVHYHWVVVAKDEQQAREIAAEELKMSFKMDLSIVKTEFMEATKRSFDLDSMFDAVIDFAKVSVEQKKIYSELTNSIKKVT